MAISIACSNCNKTLKVPDEMAGKKVRCPACKSVVAVPALEEEEVEVEEGLPPPKKSPSDAVKKEAPPPLRKRRDEEDEEDRADEDEEEDDRPRRKRKRYDEEDEEEVDVRRGGGSRRAYALGRTAGPGIALMVCGIIGTVGFTIATILNIIGMSLLGNMAAAPRGIENAAAFNVGQILGSVFMIAINAAVAYGGYQIKSLNNYRNSMATAIIAMIPVCSPCYLIGIPFGIWALVVLLDERVKSAFRS